MLSVLHISLPTIGKFLSGRWGSQPFRRLRCSPLRIGVYWLDFAYFSGNTVRRTSIWNDESESVRAGVPHAGLVRLTPNVFCKKHFCVMAHGVVSYSNWMQIVTVLEEAGRRVSGLVK